jgi:hypothetical protein
MVTDCKNILDYEYFSRLQNDPNYQIEKAQIAFFSFRLVNCRFKQDFGRHEILNQISTAEISAFNEDFSIVSRENI